MDRVASMAGVGKQSLYRRWPSKAPLVAEAVMDAYGQHGPFELPDTGDIEADLRTWLHGQAAYLGSARNVALSRALAVASADNPLDGDALYSQLAGPHHESLLRRLQTAAHRRHSRRRRPRRGRRGAHRRDAVPHPHPRQNSRGHDQTLRRTRRRPDRGLRVGR